VVFKLNNLLTRSWSHRQQLWRWVVGLSSSFDHHLLCDVFEIAFYRIAGWFEVNDYAQDRKCLTCGRTRPSIKIYVAVHM